MAKKNITSLITAITLLLFLLPIALPGKDNDKYSSQIRKEAKRFGFKISAQTTLPAGVNGSIVPPDQAEGELLRFFSALNDLGIKFVRKSDLKNVVIVRNLSRHGKKLAGHASNDCIYLKYGFDKRTVYHEMFHVFDDKHDNNAWQRLNHKDFRYLGVSSPERPLAKDMQKDLNKHYRKVKRNFDADFASKYAQTKEREDRAVTFECMVAEGKAFAARAVKSPVLYAKMMYIVKVTGKHSLMDEAYWRKKLGDNVFSAVKK